MRRYTVGTERNTTQNKGMYAIYHYTLRELRWDEENKDGVCCFVREA